MSRYRLIISATIPFILTLASILTFVFNNKLFSQNFFRLVHLIAGLHVLATLALILFSVSGVKSWNYFKASLSYKKKILLYALITLVFFISLLGLNFKENSLVALVGLFIVSVILPRLHAFKQSETLTFRSFSHKHNKRLTQIFLFTTSLSSIIVLVAEQKKLMPVFSVEQKFFLLLFVLITVSAWFLVQLRGEIKKIDWICAVRFLNEPLAIFWTTANTYISCIHAFEYIFDVISQFKFKIFQKKLNFLIFIFITAVYLIAHIFRYNENVIGQSPFWTDILVAFSIAFNFIHFETDRAIFKKTSGDLHETLFLSKEPPN